MPSVIMYVTGVAIALLTTFLSALGLVLQKRAHTGDHHRRRQSRISEGLVEGVSTPLGVRPSTPSALVHGPCRYCCMRLLAKWGWQIGLSLMITSALLSLAVITLCGQAVSSSFAALTILYALVLAKVVLKEDPTIADVIQSFVMVSGVVLVVIFGRQTGGSESVSLAVQLHEFDMKATATLASASAIVGLLILHLFLTTSRNEGLDNRRLNSSMVHLVERCAISGIMSAFTAFFIRLLFRGLSIEPLVSLKLWEFYLILLGLLLSLFFQVAYVSSALKHNDAKVVVPLYQGLVILLGVTFGWLVSGEANGKSWRDVTYFMVGVALLIGGFGSMLYSNRSAFYKLGTAAAAQQLSSGLRIIRRKKRSLSAPPLSTSRGGLQLQKAEDPLSLSLPSRFPHRLSSLLQTLLPMGGSTTGVGIVLKKDDDAASTDSPDSPSP